MNVPSLTKIEVGAAVLIGLAVLGVVIWAVRKGPGGIGKSAGKAVGDLVGGTVVGLGDAIGIPETDEQKCQAAIAAGKTWDVSLYCPAGTFLKYLAGGDTSTPAPSSSTATSNDTSSSDLAPYIGAGA